MCQRGTESAQDPGPDAPCHVAQGGERERFRRDHTKTRACPLGDLSHLILRNLKCRRRRTRARSVGGGPGEEKAFPPLACAAVPETTTAAQRHSLARSAPREGALTRFPGTPQHRISRWAGHSPVMLAFEWNRKS
eukprot:scaffold1809_cov386-Prasinococcus_capsulatus_cf.AAC.8